MKQYVAFSGGKDSTAMLLRMIELGEQIDGVFFADTGEEWEMLIDYIKEIEKIAGIPITILPPPYRLEDGMMHVIDKEDSPHHGEYRGYPITLGPCYFMRDAKWNQINKMTKGGVVCIGYAMGEEGRAKKRENVRTPLIEWGWSEERCVQYLNEKGLLNPLYMNFNRLGCIGCPKQNEASLYVIWKQHPDKWEYIRGLNEKQKLLRNDEIRFFREKPGFIGSQIIKFSDVENKFQRGWVPQKRPKYACVDCKGVTKVFTDQVSLCDF